MVKFLMCSHGYIRRLYPGLKFKNKFIVYQSIQHKKNLNIVSFLKKIMLIVSFTHICKIFASPYHFTKRRTF
jgi:hypothetical protein